jgi:hypothetical protein
LAVVSVVLRGAALVTAIAAGVAFAQEPDSFTVEPPELVPDRGEERSDANSQDVNLAKLEKDLARAKRNSADAQHLYRIGVISQVDVEQRALRVIRLEADLAKRRLEVAQQQATSVGSVLVNGQPQTDESTKAELARLSEAAQAAAAKRDRAEIEAAEANLRRQQRLFAVGTGRKSDVAKAEQKLAELKTHNN